MPGGYPHVGTCAEALRPGVVIACGPLSVGAFILGPRVMISSIMALLVCGRWKVRVIPTIASVIVVALVVWFAWGIYSYNIGPSGTEAFRWYLADPIPSSVSEIKIHCAPHFQGRNIFLSFTIGPIDLQEIIVQKHFRLARHRRAVSPRSLHRDRPGCADNTGERNVLLTPGRRCRYGLGGKPRSAKSLFLV